MYSLTLSPDGRLKSSVTKEDLHSGRVNAEQGLALLFLHKQFPCELTAKPEKRKRLLALIGVLQSSIATEARHAIQNALERADLFRAPMRPLSLRQRLGYIDELDHLVCTKALGSFVPGRKYSVRTIPIELIRPGTRLNIEGELDDVEWYSQEAAVLVKEEHGREHSFLDVNGAQASRLCAGDQHGRANSGGIPFKPDHCLSELLDHFEIPDPPGIAELNAAPKAQALAMLEQIENLTGLKFKAFQREDLSTAACVDGCILAWDCGGGKTLAMFAWPLLKLGFSRQGQLRPREPVLIVASEDLHSQIASEAKKHFGINMIALRSQDEFLRLSTITAAGRVLPPAFYLTSYCALTQNGVDPIPEVDLQAHLLNLGESHYYPEISRSIRCVHSPTLADLCQDSFGAIVCDEGVRLKGGDSLIGKGVRQMNARFRLVLTGTPIKNRIGDIFHLAHFVSGPADGPHPRFPFRSDDHGAFVKRFSVLERNLTAEERTGRRSLRPIPKLCSVAALQRALAPILIRRCKEEFGESLVPMNIKTVRVPFGSRQALEYKTILETKYLDKNKRPAIGAKLQALRAAS